MLPALENAWFPELIVKVGTPLAYEKSTTSKEVQF
jgi:hypothetical protein